MTNPRTVREIPCTDLVGRDRVARVYPVAQGKVGIQAPPGEWLELTVRQLHELWTTARDACRGSWFIPAREADDEVNEPTSPAGSTS